MITSYWNNLITCAHHKRYFDIGNVPFKFPMTVSQDWKMSAKTTWRTRDGTVLNGKEMNIIPLRQVLPDDIIKSNYKAWNPGDNVRAELKFLNTSWFNTLWFRLQQNAGTNTIRLWLLHPIKLHDCIDKIIVLRSGDTYIGHHLYNCPLRHRHYLTHWHIAVPTIPEILDCVHHQGTSSQCYERSILL